MEFCIITECKKLHNHCLELICVNPPPLITWNDFSSPDKDVLFELLERDDLLVEEIDVWDGLIKWVFNRHLDLKTMMVKSNGIKKALKH